MVAKAEKGEWRPFFPNARILISDQQLQAFVQSDVDESDPVAACWQALIQQGVVDTFQDSEEILPGVVAEVTNQHCAGHSVFHFNGGQATFTGHLAVSPVHLATGACEALNEHAEGTFEVLHRIAADGRTLIGPLWPIPGKGKWSQNRLA